MQAEPHVHYHLLLPKHHTGIVSFIWERLQQPTNHVGVLSANTGGTVLCPISVTSYLWIVILLT